MLSSTWRQSRLAECLCYINYILHCTHNVYLVSKKEEGYTRFCKMQSYQIGSDGNLHSPSKITDRWFDSWGALVAILALHGVGLGGPWGFLMTLQFYDSVYGKSVPARLGLSGPLRGKPGPSKTRSLRSPASLAPPRGTPLSIFSCLFSSLSFWGTPRPHQPAVHHRSWALALISPGTPHPLIHGQWKTPLARAKGRPFLCVGGTCSLRSFFFLRFLWKENPPPLEVL